MPTAPNLLAHYNFTNSTLLFFALPASLSLLETGLVSPKPCAYKRDGSIPASVNALTTVCALA